MTTNRIHLLSSPRNLSTALMYSFAQRQDCTVVDEPLYAYFLKNSGKQHPGRAKVLQNMDTDPVELIAQLNEKDYGTANVFFKGMTHHLLDLPLDFLSQSKNIIYIRNPRAIINSYAKVIPTIKMEDIGIEQQLNLLKILKQQGSLACVLDSDELLKDPRTLLKKLCSSCAIPFDERMLQWEAGARQEDGSWASYWYTNVHQSTGFLPYKEREITLNKQNEALAKRCADYYLELKEIALKSK